MVVVTVTFAALPALLLVIAASTAFARAEPAVLKPAAFEHYIRTFNTQDDELVRQKIPNAQAWDFLRDNIPWFECPDPDLERTYYFRWWTYRKHLKDTPDGLVVTEFLPPVPWAGKHNTISCPAAHHFYEGRWLRADRLLDDYARFWFRGGGEPRKYSFWAADALWARYLATGDAAAMIDLLPDLMRNFESWEKERFDPAAGLFFQNDGEDGMEVSIGGSGYRATLNSYMYGECVAIAAIADLAGKFDVAARFRNRATDIRHRVRTRLWDPAAGFFKVLPRGDGARLADVRELHGFTPWYFHLPDTSHAVAWTNLMDPKGFRAAFGLTTAEQRHPAFAVAYTGHECQWNGPSWPYATAVTLTALANYLQRQGAPYVQTSDYFELLRTYARSHQLKRADGTLVPWIDENLNPFSGDWIARTRLSTWKDGTWSEEKGGRERGKDYNHSTFNDLVISGLVGLRPRADAIVEVHPLLPTNTWDYFCLDDVPYHGRRLTIAWDRTGQRYGRGAGLQVLADGNLVARSDRLERLEGRLPAANKANDAAASGWRKHPANPVLGGALGTCFDVALLAENREFRMWFSWRPRKSLAVVTSADGVRWSEPVTVLGPESATGWEEDINRPAVVRREDGYHLWYTGQTSKNSRLGYATSADGIHWTRRSRRPVMEPDQPWEKVAIMCPHVLWDGEQKQFRMWYSGGDQYEPDAIGYATSPDGMTWTKHAAQPIFQADPNRPWESHKVTACQVVLHDGWHYMFYIGFRDVDHAQIGLARSRDGVSNWERLPANPIVSPDPNQWDHDACYKPFALFDGARWRLWYNGRHGNSEQIGLVTREGADLGFPTSR
ncbi:MAG: hypothetical protein JNK85_15430 [Verrucomicrobiales bacterium]|nr:hypothetical protein [Verrucomicrobiales bacterium]